MAGSSMDGSSMAVPILVSPDAGRGEARSSLAGVFDTVRRAGLEPRDITGASAAGSLAAAQHEVAEGAERLLVVGGDGLVNLALQAVATTPTILGVVPVGTGNDFVRGIDGFESETVLATERALGPGRDLDAIRTNHGWVASVATAGFSGDVNARANSLRWPRGPKRYSVATVLQLPRLQTRDITLTVDGHRHQLRSALIAIANTAWFGGGMEICPGADPADSILEVTVVADVGRLEMLRFFDRVFKGTHLGHAKVTTLRGREILIECEQLDLWGDGELLGSAPVQLTAVPGALRLAC